MAEINCMRFMASTSCAAVRVSRSYADTYMAKSLQLPVLATSPPIIRLPVSARTRVRRQAAGSVEQGSQADGFQVGPVGAESASSGNQLSFLVLG